MAIDNGGKAVLVTFAISFTGACLYKEHVDDKHFPVYQNDLAELKAMLERNDPALKTALFNATFRNNRDTDPSEATMKFLMDNTTSTLNKQPILDRTLEVGCAKKVVSLMERGARLYAPPRTLQEYVKGEEGRRRPHTRKLKAYLKYTRPFK